MLSAIRLHFEEAAQEALAVAEALQGDTSAIRAATLNDGNSKSLPMDVSDVWRWLNAPVTLSDILPKDSSGFSKRR